VACGEAGYAQLDVSHREYPSVDAKSFLGVWSKFFYMYILFNNLTITTLF
jgi:hypothetical protein